MREASMSAATVANAEKIHGDDAAAVGGLLAKVERGEVKPKDVSEMWKAARKVCGARKSRHAAKPAVGGEGDAEITRALTAALARQAAAWIWGAETAAEAEERKRREAPRQFLARDAVCVRTLVEFPVRVESAERARRIDLAAVCVENQTTADWMDVALRGVEVKVSEADLGRDAKMGDYGLFMDYMYVACPADLVRQARVRPRCRCGRGGPRAGAPGRAEARGRADDGVCEAGAARDQVGRFQSVLESSRVER